MSKTNKQQVPKIRFEGFSEDWENNGLSSVFSIFSGNAFSSKDQAEEGIIWLKIADVGIQKMTPNNLSYLPFGYENTYEKYLIKKDDVVLALTRPILDKRLKIAVAGKRYHGALLNQRVGKIVSANNHIPFIYCLLQQEKLISQFESSIAGTDPPNLSLNEIKDISLTIPTKKEQTAIGNFFQQLDKLIELQTRAVESAETYKKAMLQKMFPQKGEKVPRVRFEGFSEDWVEKALSRIVNISSGVTGDTSLSKGKYFVTRIETIADGVINFNKVGFLNEKPDDRFLLVKGDILYSNINSLNHIGKVALFNDDKELYHGINLLRLIPMKDKIEPLFLFISMLTKDKLDWAKRHANQAVSQASINQTTLGQQYFYLPSILEQTQIGNFFQKLDQNIEAQKQKLEKYRDMKKALLQRMFV